LTFLEQIHGKWTSPIKSIRYSRDQSHSYKEKAVLFLFEYLIGTIKGIQCIEERSFSNGFDQAANEVKTEFFEFQNEKTGYFASPVRAASLEDDVICRV
jgi:hypothetical protein